MLTWLTSQVWQVRKEREIWQNYGEKCSITHLSGYLSPHPALCQSKVLGKKTVASFHSRETEARSGTKHPAQDICLCSFPHAKVWLRLFFFVFIMRVWRRQNRKACFLCLPGVNAASPSHTTIVLLLQCFPTLGPQGGYTQINGEPKEPGMGRQVQTIS